MRGSIFGGVKTPGSIYTLNPDVATSLARCRVTEAAWGESESRRQYPGNGRLVDCRDERDVPVLKSLWGLALDPALLCV
jgi:hypothetical protein